MIEQFKRFVLHQSPKEIVSKLIPQTIEEVWALEGVSGTGWTSDSQEAFLSPYDPKEGDLDGLAQAMETMVQEDIDLNQARQISDSLTDSLVGLELA